MKRWSKGEGLEAGTREGLAGWGVSKLGEKCLWRMEVGSPSALVPSQSGP